MEVESSKERISSYYYCQQIGNATFKFGISFCASLEIILNSFQNSFIINVHRLFQHDISSLKWFYFELRQEKYIWPFTNHKIYNHCKVYGA